MPGMSSRIPRGRGGKKGQQHRATPGDLRSYEVTPSSAVTVTKPDGTVEKQPARKAKAAMPTARRPSRRGPAICAMCGDPITDKVWVSREQGPARGKPVHSVCETRANARTAERKAEKAATAASRPLSVMEENRQLFARQDEIRRMRQSKRS